MTTDARGGRLEARPRIVAMPRPTGRPHVFVSHGRRDEVLPVASCGRRVVQRLRGAGYHVEYHEFDGGHAVPTDAARAAPARVAWRRIAPDVGNAARADAHVPDSRPGAG